MSGRNGKKDVETGRAGAAAASSRHPVLSDSVQLSSVDSSSEKQPRLVVTVAIRAFLLNQAQCCLGTAQRHTAADGSLKETSAQI